MVSKKTVSKSTQKDGRKLKAKDVLEKIAIRHLEDKYGKISIYKPKYWKVGAKIVRHYCSTDPRCILFITALSKRTIKNVQNENALVAGINYYAGYNNKFTIYFVQPEIFLKHYINAKIKPKKGGNEWHIEIKHSKKQLVFVRKDAENVEIPTDKNNYYLQFEMTDDE